MGRPKKLVKHGSSGYRKYVPRISRIMTRQAVQEKAIVIPALWCSGAAPSIEQSERDKRRKSTNFKEMKKMDTNTFESHLEKESTKSKVLVWIRRKHIFRRKYVFIPIVCWSHWSLLILCHFGAGLQSKTRKPCMLLLDSLEKTDPKRLEPDIRRFVLDIYRSGGRQEDENLISKIPLMVPKVPQQTNGHECGIFVLFFIYMFLRHAPNVFSISRGYPYFLKEDWFNLESLESFCKRKGILG